MIWHVVVRVEAQDAFLPPLSPSDPRLIASFGASSEPAYVGNNVAELLLHDAGASPIPMVQDLLHLAMAVYTADLRVARLHGADRWSREFVVYLPVSDVAAWTAAHTTVVRMLQFLTGDKWSIEYRQRSAAPASAPATVKTPRPDVTCLFSGGIDSLVASLDLLASGCTVALVGHHGAGITNARQTAVLEVILRKYGGTVLPFLFYVQPPKSGATDGEQTMRSRSLLFFALGVAVAVSSQANPRLVVGENGLMSLNVPLTRARTGSSSTRTTHPHYVELFRKALALLGVGVRLELPYRFQTKGEMVSSCKDSALLRTAVPESMSCSRAEAMRFQGHSPDTHCGYCTPCIIRRACLRAGGLPQDSYVVDVLTSPPRRDSKKASDLRAFKMALARLKGAGPVRYLFDVLGTGPIPPAEAAQLADVYRRGMLEVSDFLG